MRPFTVKELTEAVNGTLVNGSENSPVFSVCTDSRTAGAGDVFFAIVGEKNNAHSYLGQVLEKGCRTLVISEYDKVPKEQFLGQIGEPDIILVEDTTAALQKLAAYYLGTLPLKKKIAVTGSVGKTSTRDMLYFVASQKYRTARSIKNFNNNFGLPLSIMEFPGDTEVAILEMGMSVRGSIDFLAELTRPDIAVITNIGISHIENFGDEGREGILKTKLEVTNYFNGDNVLIVNSDNDLLSGDKVNGEYRLVRVGSDRNCDFQVSGVKDYGDKGIEFVLLNGGDRAPQSISLPVPGAHNAINAALAVAVAKELGIDAETAVEGLRQAELTEKRLNVKTNSNGIKVIDDTYNAAPDSVKSAINTLMATEAGKNKDGRPGRHIAIIGDMYELGQETVNGHREVGKYAAEKGVDMILAIGESAVHIYNGWVDSVPGAEKVLDKPLISVDRAGNRQAEYFSDKNMVVENITRHIETGDVILVKASRGMHLEEVVKAIMQQV